MSRPLFSLVVLALISAAGSARARPTVVVAPFTTGSSSEYEWIGTALAESLTDRLIESGDAHAFSQKQWAAVLRERDIDYPPVRGVDDARLVAKQLGADTFVIGTYRAAWPFIEITSQRFALDGAEPIAVVQLEANIDDILDVEGKIARTLFGTDFKKAAALKPPTKNLLAWRALAHCRESLSLQSMGPRAQLWIPAALAGAARISCEEALTKDKTLDEAAAFVALTRFVLGERAEGMKAALDIVKKRKSAGWPDLIASFLLRLSGDVDKSLSILEAAAKKNPTHLHLRTTLGETYAELKRFDDAERVYREILADAPRQPWVMVQLGKVLSQKGDIASALKITDEAIALGGDDAILLLEKASRQIDAKKFDDAETTLRKALDVDPRIAALYLRLGYVYLETDNLDLAFPILKKALYEADRESERRVKGFAHYDLAKIAARRGKNDDALLELSRAVSAGLTDRTLFEKDADLKNVVAAPGFAKLFPTAP